MNIFGGRSPPIFEQWPAKQRLRKAAQARPPGAAVTAAVTRGLGPWLEDLWFTSLTEFKLGNGRRADVVGLNASGTILMIEVKSTPEDFRGDAKWLDYVPYCDSFSFAVPPHFPWEILPATCGVIMAGAHSAAVMREAPQHRRHAPRRKALTLRVALVADQRRSSIIDPRL